jgi:hypothetical protein
MILFQFSKSNTFFFLIALILSLRMALIRETKPIYNKQIFFGRDSIDSILNAAAVPLKATLNLDHKTKFKIIITNSDKAYASKNHEHCHQIIFSAFLVD